MNNYKEIFDYLLLIGLGPDISFSKASRLSPEKCLVIVDTLIKLTSFEEIASDSPYNFMTSSRLSGHSYLDSTLSSRKSNVNNLLANSILYADVLWIKNPFDDYFHVDESYFEDLESRVELLMDISIFYQYKSSLNSGLVKICGTEEHFCYDCLVSSIGYHNFPDEFHERSQLIEDSLRKMFKKEAKFYVRKDSRGFYLNIDTKNTDLFEPDQDKIYIDEDLHPNLEKVNRRKSKKLFLKEIDDSNQIYCRGIKPIVDDILMHQVYSVSNGGRLSYYTNREVDVKLINSSNSPKMRVRNRDLLTALSHVVPALGSIPLEKIIELRLKEPEHFEAYRNGMDKVIKYSPELNVNDLRDAFHEEVSPSISSIKLQIKSKKRILNTGLIKGVVTGGLCIGLGAMQTAFPQASGPMIAAGSIASIGSVANRLLKSFSRKQVDRDDQYYFLWKLQGLQ